MGHRWRHQSVLDLMEDNRSSIDSISIIMLNGIMKQFLSTFVYSHNASHICFNREQRTSSLSPTIPMCSGPVVHTSLQSAQCAINSSVPELLRHLLPDQHPPMSRQTLGVVHLGKQ